MTSEVNDRDEIIVQELREELFGPAPAGRDLDISQPQTVFQKKEDAYGAWRQKGSGEEILTRDGPRVRYGVGVLHPHETLESEDVLIGDRITVLKDDDGALGEVENAVSDNAVDRLDAMKGGLSGELDDDFELSLANTYQQSAMAISFVLQMKVDSFVAITVTGGRYEQFKVLVERKEQTWWRRIPVRLLARVRIAELANTNRFEIKVFDLEEGLGRMAPRLELFLRRMENPKERLVTVALTNRTAAGGNYEARCLFQSYFSVEAVSDGVGIIAPYPSTKRALDEEERSLELLYREMRTYAVGHGCAADWDTEGRTDSAKVVKALAFPTFETPNITPNIERQETGERLEIPMLLLSDVEKRSESLLLLNDLVREYRSWISERRREVESREFPERHRDIANIHLKRCEECADRMAIGIRLLEFDDDVYTAFRLANLAILLQQIQSKLELRTSTYNEETKQFDFSGKYQLPNTSSLPVGRGNWRPFQIAFLLLSLAGTSDRRHTDRDIVDLIWFPTGGGKTEAYLALAAFSIFYSRLSGTSKNGVNVLMRYTLRLLTAQQFQRAASLICSMEWIRSHEAKLGSDEISIGIWLGGQVTPNTDKDAISAFNRLAKYSDAKNPFLVVRCPWCGCEMGRYNRSPKAKIPRVRGYKSSNREVILHCPDAECFFHERLPVYVTDDQVYRNRPSFVIATVDKFAALAWSSLPRALFGLGDDGSRICLPPNLIIQDELHLISGPLGSIFALYESLIEELCSMEENGRKLKPKVIASTATIRRFERQIRDLYSRSESRLFPPPGVEAGDSFFARFERYSDTKQLKPGKRYVGVFAANLGSLQTAEQRVYAALLQAPMRLDEKQRDPWWTLLLFFNSLRELGTSVSLLQSDVATYLLAIRNRKGITPAELRHIKNPKELTSRLGNDEVPRALHDLSVRYRTGGHAVDVCLASSIIEVGVDIDRLGLMAVVGQPKSTSQYIQVTGRIGRQFPGLVVTIYAVSKPRDRSHFEKFRTYHERLYAQVEPTSVTPFSSSVLERVLHAVLVGYVRQKGPTAAVSSPYPFPNRLLEEISDLVRERAEIIDPDQMGEIDRILNKRFKQWKKWAPKNWESWASDVTPLLREAGAYASIGLKAITWPTQRAMRNVDRECQSIITPLTVIEGDSND
jgi:Helicase conserved C-terminal domain